MKVIVAGMSKTGTKTMATALHALGYNVYDYFENFEFLCDDWMKILKEGGSDDDIIKELRRMYKDVDAVMDIPCNHFWEQLHKAFPEAKVTTSLFCYL